MAGIVAGYRVATIDTIMLGVGQEVRRSLDFNLPQPNVLLVDSPMIATFVLNSSMGSLHMRIDINGTAISNRQYTDGDLERCIQDIATEILVVQNPQKITFTVLQGSAILSDVVVWFQRDARPDEETVSQ